ncbi:MAG: type III secretion system chaperone [Litoreibacter sp.]|uniref:type III secretion system chaperone n=1 Tax=Litoreibacter sp. TaxID=1969459 RepID=UPI003297C6F5
MKSLALALPLIAALTAPLVAQEAETSEPPMTLSRMAEIFTVLDPNVESAGNAFRLVITDIPVVIVTDEGADRMRAMIPIRSAEGMDPEEMLRVMQANFDTALDARYAIAQGQLWATFIHPLSPLEKDQLISGLGQVVNLARTYGTLFTGGAMQFGGGDSQQLHRDLIDKLLEKGEEI